MKRIVFIFLLGIMTNIILAQALINVQDISRPNDVFPNSGDSALVVVRSHKSIELFFSLSKNGQSSKSLALNPSRTEIDASDDGVSYFVFPTGKQYSSRILTISTPEGGSVSVDIDLEPKQVKTFRITRPFNFIVEKCYTKHRDKALDETSKGNYTEALKEFKLAYECFDTDSIENAENIRFVNTLIKYLKDGDTAYDKNDYKEASKHYVNIRHLNPSDSLTATKYKVCQDYLTYEYNTAFTKAMQKYEEKEYKAAYRLFKDALTKADNLDDVYIRDKFKLYTTEWIEKTVSEYDYIIEKKERRKIFKHSLTYEYRKDTPVGFSYSSLMQGASGGFIQIDLNSMLFEEIRSTCRYGDTKFAEFNLALGWTKRLFNFLWIHYGPGLTFKFYHGSYKGSYYPKIGYGESDLLDPYYMGEDVVLPKDEIPEKYEKGWKKTNTAFAVSPVVGFDLKFQFIVLRLTYQYRFATDSRLADFIGRSRISIGLGVAF